MEIALLKKISTDVFAEVEKAVSAFYKNTSIDEDDDDLSVEESSAIELVLRQTSEQVIIVIYKALQARVEVAKKKVGDTQSAETEDISRHLASEISKFASSKLKHETSTQDSSKLAEAKKFVEEISGFVANNTSSLLSSKSGKKELLGLLAQLESMLR